MEDELVGWHHRFNGHGYGWTLGVGDGQGGLACSGSWGHKGSDMTEWLNLTELRPVVFKMSIGIISTILVTIFYLLPLFFVSSLSLPLLCLFCFYFYCF